jgi:CobQ-like glutamine amidotransferase family enzyme
MSATSLDAALLHPLLTVACGDDANTLALAHRAMRRDIGVDLVTVHGDDPIPSADIYFLGGSGQPGVHQLADLLAASDAFTDRVRSGAVVLAIDAGMDALGRGLVDERGQILAPGLGVLGFTSARGPLQDSTVVTHPVPDDRMGAAPRCPTT